MAYKNWEQDSSEALIFFLFVYLRLPRVIKERTEFIVEKHHNCKDDCSEVTIVKFEVGNAKEDNPFK